MSSLGAGGPVPQLDTGLRDAPTGVAFIDAQAQRKSTYSGGGDGDTCVEIATLSVPTPPSPPSSSTSRSVILITPGQKGHRRHNVRPWQPSIPGTRRSSPTPTPPTPSCVPGAVCSTSSPRTSGSSPPRRRLGAAARPLTRPHLPTPLHPRGLRPYGTPARARVLPHPQRPRHARPGAPDHTRIRRLVSKAFTPRTVEQLKPYVSQLAGELVDGLVAKGGGDLLADVAEPSPSR